MDRDKRRIPAYEIAAAGIVSGLLYFLVSLISMFPHEQLALMGSGFMRFNLFAYTAAFWVLAFTGLAAVLGLLTYPLVAAVRRRWAVIAARFVIFFGLAAAFTAGLSVWTYYSNSAPLLPQYVLMGDIRKIMYLILLSSAAFGFGMSFLVTFGRGAVRVAFQRLRPAVAAVIIVCLAYAVFANLAGGVLMREDGGGESRMQAKGPVVVFGIDAGTWNAALPLVQAGDLPAFKGMMERGSYGYLATYGHQFTPMVWTSIATGKTVDKHGIRHFGNLSDDWKAAPVWSILSDAGRTVAVANWVCTWPPFEVKGAFVSKIMASRGDRTYFSPDYSYLKSEADSIVSLWAYEVPGDDEARIVYAEHEIAYLSMLDQAVFSKISPDFVAHYFYSPDMLQHFFWKDMDPDMLDSPQWSGETTEPYHSGTIRDGWLAADRMLAALMEHYGTGATYFVLSDHGMRPIRKRMVNFKMNALLGALGYTSMVSGRPDRGVSICYELEGGPHFRFDIKINPSSYTDGSGGKEDFDSIRSRVVTDLKQLRIKETGRPLFRSVESVRSPAPEGEPEIRAYASGAILDLMNRDEHVVVRDREIGLSDLLIPHPWSGKHRARGMFLAAGPAIEHRYVGAWIADDPYASIFRYVNGVMAAPTALAPLFRALHLVDDATTLDATPTFLYLLGVPVADDMDGRILKEIIDPDFLAANPVSTVPRYGQGAISQVEEGSIDQEHLRERLKALGYIQ
jgi:predicted AlkP superfamily phosphohydrolase/phosphomutase